MLRKIFKLPGWYKGWNEKDPINYGPAILVAIFGVAVIAATTIIVVARPYGTESLQTGPRGNGMSVPEFIADLNTPDPTIAALAELDMGDDIFDAMRAWTGIPTLFEDDDDYQTIVAKRMVEMTQNINENWDGHVNANKEVGVTCYTCHRGQPVPSEVWYKITPVTLATAGWSANQNRATSNSQQTSLPSDALEEYLLNYEIIGVHDLESRVPGIPGQDVPAIQNAERTYALMNYNANSLGVNCTFCHNTRAFYDGSQVTPQWGTASLGIAMVQELNEEYIVPLEEVLPAERLGPVHADVPKAACKTCHKGYQQPLQGTNVIADWPQLQSVGALDYE